MDPMGWLIMAILRTTCFFRGHQYRIILSDGPTELICWYCVKDFKWSAVDVRSLRSSSPYRADQNGEQP